MWFALRVEAEAGWNQRCGTVGLLPVSSDAVRAVWSTDRRPRPRISGLICPDLFHSLVSAVPGMSEGYTGGRVDRSLAPSTPSSRQPLE